MQLCGSLSILWHCLSLGLEWKLTFSSPVATAEFSKFAGILSGALSQHHLSGFENSSTGIPSPPLALFVVMLPKAHSTSHSSMSGSRWVITASWLSGSWRSFLYSSSVYSCHLLLISSASVRSILFLLFILPIFGWIVPLVSNFLEAIYCQYFYDFSTTTSHRGFPSALCWSQTPLVLTHKAVCALLRNCNLAFLSVNFAYYFCFLATIRLLYFWSLKPAVAWLQVYHRVCAQEICRVEFPLLMKMFYLNPPIASCCCC